MVKKKKAKNSSKKNTSRNKTSSKGNAKKRRSAYNRQKETVRVKTFIVEKPVYVQAPSRFQRIRNRASHVFSSDESRYSRKRSNENNTAEESLEEENYANEEPLDDLKNNDSEEYAESDSGELDSADTEFPAGEGEENLDDYSDESLPEEGSVPTHVRSHGLFENVWWKKGAIKGFIVWLLLVLLIYVLQAMDMANAENWKRWAFFLVLFVLLGMTYQKFISGRIKI
jgi:hypothetical protein